ncbi:MAG: DUF3656 domain-containing protein [Oscillospiraceae bacterium]|nr:DUF3656 domain-containing protein [Oscillospiraceae bacterium]
MMELLVPAGSPEAVTAAVQNGADAVYMSFDVLSDCRQAENFSDGAFEAAVRYCRVRGCRVYLALNAPVRDEELQKAGGLALRAQRAGVDAVIVRDLGVYYILRRLLPEMPLFADARLGFFTPESLAIAASLGFQRVFLPPELSLAEIRRLTAAAEVEIAVYAQTTLCAAACGTCRMSSAAGQGSADRGLCARPCRENYTFGGRWDTAPLSWKDRSLLPDIPALEEAGVACVCLGDRDRRPEYTAAYTRVFFKAVRDKAMPAGPDLARMEEAFAPCGVAKTEIYEPAEPHEMDARVMERYLAEVRRTYTETEERRVDVSFAVVAQAPDKPIHLGAQDTGKNTAVIEGPYPDPAGDVELTEAALADAMYRTAGTPFRCVNMQCVTEADLRVSGIELDAARRRLLYKLSEERSRAPERKEGVFPPEPGNKSYARLPVVNFAFQTAAQMTPEMAALRPACVYAPAELLAESPEVMDPFREEGCEIAAMLPAVVCGQAETDELRALLARVREAGVERALTGNLGLALLAGQEGLKLRGDMDLAVTNAYALQSLAAAGFLSVCLSPELTLAQVRSMSKCVDTELVIYGRLPVMVAETCLIKASAGRCVCTTPGQMADTRGGVWPVTKHFGCRNTVWASRKLWLGDAAADWVDCGLWGARLNFSTESPRECLEVANSYIHGTGYRPNGMTRGNYYRGVL